MVRTGGTGSQDAVTGHLSKRFPQLFSEIAPTPVEGIVVVKAGYELGIELRVNGTPAIAMPDGSLQPGYLPADRLLNALGLGRKQQDP